jgi:hypothetical protein
MSAMRTRITAAMSLSREGQEVIVKDVSYLPLPPELAAQPAKRLD